MPLKVDAQPCALQGTELYGWQVQTPFFLTNNLQNQTELLCQTQVTMLATVSNINIFCETS